MKRLSIIIVNYNTEKLVESAVRSVEKQLQKDWEVIVVDNASSDNSVEAIKHVFPWVHVIKNDKNLGFSAGNNVGIKKAEGAYIMLLNSDALFTNNGSILTLLDYMDNHGDVAVVTPRVQLAHGELDKASHRGFPTPWNALTYFTQLERVFGDVPLLSRIVGGYHQTWKNLNHPHEIDSATGAAMVVRKKAIDQVGLLDENFFMYGEDIDWCYRFKQARWKIVFHPGFEVLHLKNQSGIKREVQTKEDQLKRTQTQAHFFDTMGQFYEKHYTKTYPDIVNKLVYKGISVIKKLKGA